MATFRKLVVVLALCVASAGGPALAEYQQHEREHEHEEAAPAAAIVPGVWMGDDLADRTARVITKAPAHTERKLQGTPPNPVTDLIATPSICPVTREVAEMTLNWTDPTTGPLPTAYKVYVTDVLVETTDRSWTRIAPLVAGTMYRFTVMAVNYAGASSPVSVNKIAETQPSRPLNPQAVPGDGWVDLYWDPPKDNGGTPIDYYTFMISPYQQGPYGPCVMTGPTSCRMSGLTNGQVYAFRVIATKNHTFSMFVSPMMSPPSTPEVEARPHTLPSGPRNFRVFSGGATTVTLGWEEPSDPDPQAEIEGYQIHMYEGNLPQYDWLPLDAVTAVVPAWKRSVQLTGLVPGVEYSFGVSAFTRASVGGMTVMPRYIAAGVYIPLAAPPVAPGDVAVMGLGSGAAKVQWSEPDPSGGGAIKAYRVTLTPVQDGTGAKLTVKQRKRVVAECSAEDPNPCASDTIVLGLANGVRYSVTVAARNKIGWSPESSPVVFALPEADVNRSGKNGAQKH